MNKYTIFYSPQFQKGRARAIKRGLDVSKLDEAVEILPQRFETPVREGFTVVEWGGSRVEKP